MSEQRATSGAGSALKSWVRALEMTAPIARHPTVTLPVRVQEWAAKYGDAPALISDQVTLSYRGLAEQANRYARWALAQGLVAGDVVALVMHNEPDYLALWLGVTSVGGIVALINTNLVEDSLAHAINVAEAKQVIAGADLAAQIFAVRDRLPSAPTLWVHGGRHATLASIDDVVHALSGEPLDDSQRTLPRLRDWALYVYTSGTTGLPKAARISHYRLMQWSHWFAGMLNTTADDRMYNCLPMYHSIGGVAAIGAALVNGGSVVIAPRFSARRFWDDIVHWDCTIFQYIGELCRFLLNSPPHPLEREHHLRLACGNGLAADVWEPLQERFQIPRIVEFFAATESTFSLYNVEGKVGSIGRIPSFLGHRFPVALVKFDVDANAPVRGAESFCIRCAPDEAGEAISKISDDEQPDSSGARFDGYTDSAASEKKILRDVFERGDAWFRSGDLMRKDAEGFFYFVDRIGDTFRWKGENVSTTEVTQVVSGARGVIEATVFGVSMPGNEGRAGMAAVLSGPDFRLEQLEEHLVARLPDYAHPLFVRILTELDRTGTFRPKKQELVRVGYDPNATVDPIYFYDRTTRHYDRVDAALFDRIRAGAIRF